MSTRIPQNAAALLVVATCAGNAPDDWFIEIRHTYDGPGMRQKFFPVRDYRAAARYAIAQAAGGNVYVSATPRIRPAGKETDVRTGWLLWTDIDQDDGYDRVMRFPAAPSFIIKTGTPGRVLAAWQLSEGVPAAQVERDNRRLTLALEGDMAHTSANEIIRVPGTLNHKHDPPRPVVCVAIDPYTYAAQELAGHLTDPLAAKPESRPRARTEAPVDHDDPLHQIPSAEYIPALTGREPGRDGKIQCPFHDDNTPSLHVYDDGWYCFGCERGGTIIDFGAELYGIEPRGASFHELRRRLARELLRARGAAA